MNEQTKALLAKNPLVAATLAARERTGVKGIGTRVKQGKIQVVRVEYAKGGKSTVTPLSDWLRGPAVIEALNSFK